MNQRNTSAVHTVRFAGQSIETTVTNHAPSVDSWVQSVRSRQQGVVGLDCEWKPNRYVGQCNKVATLQLCKGNKCLIVQLFYMDSVPQSLKDFLGDVSFTFVGVEVGHDVEKLLDHYGIRCEKWADLEPLCRDYMGMRYVRKLGLKGYSREILGVPMDKPRHVSMSNWENRTLTDAQVQYGCIDAYVSYRLGRKLVK